jgi:hypothetical protein
MQLIKSRTRWRGCDGNEDNMQYFWSYRHGEGYDACTKMDLKLCVMDDMD